MTSKFPVCHVVERTSKFGEPFIGTCLLCGASGLTLNDALVLCPNPHKLTYVESMLAALEGELPKKKEPNCEE